MFPDACWALKIKSSVKTVYLYFYYSFSLILSHILFFHVYIFILFL